MIRRGALRYGAGLAQHFLLDELQPVALAKDGAGEGNRTLVPILVLQWCGIRPDKILDFLWPQNTCSFPVQNQGLAATLKSEVLPSSAMPSVNKRVLSAAGSFG